MSGMRPKAAFNFYLSCDVNVQVKLKVLGLQGNLGSSKQHAIDDPEPQPSALFVEAKLTTPEDTLGLETKTTYADSQPNGCTWNEMLTFCVKYRDLPHNTQLALTVYKWSSDGHGLVLVGGTTMHMFNKKGRLKTGEQKLKIWEGVPPCVNVPSTTPGKVPLAERGPVGKLEHLLKLYARGDLPQAEWLDSLMMQEVRQLQEQESADFLQSGGLRIHLDLPRFPHSVLYQQPVTAPAPSLKDPTLPERPSPTSIISLLDPEVGKDNPAELKAQKLARSLARGMVDRDLKPNSDERKRIAAVLKLPPNKPLRKSEKALLWRFRFSLTQDKRALTKFLKCVDFGDVSEAKQATELMQQWAPIDTADALELLSPDFTNEEVRAHAASMLAAKEDEELLYYLLQLVQALRYEPHHPSRLSRFLVTRAEGNPVFALFLHWYLVTELEDPSFGPRANAVLRGLTDKLQATPQGDGVWQAIRVQADLMYQLAYITKDLKSSRVKATKATERLQQMLSDSGPCGELTSLRVALPLNPNIMLDGLVPAECSCFKSAQLPLKLAYRVDLRSSPWSHAVPPSAHPGGVLPPSQRTGIVQVGDSLRCIMIYKKGDDLRQDQFILQMISLMDRLLKRESLDLRLTPYRVLPTSSDDGLVEFVPSVPLARLLADHRTIHRYLAQFHPDPSGPFGLAKEVVENFVRSCAGYCVMTYILGVGDRHLDNLMITTDGRLFHIDFGYILGNDPKPFPPPMKLCKEMIEAMGGSDSSYYQDFRQLCCEAYNILRKNADLILSLFHLMAGSSIAVIREDPEKALLKIQEKLRLDADDEQAVELLQQLINESATALMPQFIETTHRWAQYWR